jgi:plasmid stabilization system protein ParE
MARVEVALEVGDDFDRILDHLALHNVANAAARIREIVAAFDVLETNPQIGRLEAGETRELVIGRGSHGYLALYRYVSEIDTVFVLAVRSQREAGYKGL